MSTHTHWLVIDGEPPEVINVVDNASDRIRLRYLPERTCHIVKTWSDSDFVEDWNYKCSQCGCFIPVYERDPESGDVIRAASYCPSCGRKVVDE